MIHTPHDGRGRRNVYVDGRKVLYAIYADTERGLVEKAKLPFEVDETGDDIKTEFVYGRVSVIPMTGPLLTAG